jgi:hypothetical protein
MNTQVYYHRLRRIYDLYLKEYFNARGNGDFDTPEKVLGHNDMTMPAEIIRDAEKAGEPVQRWARRIRDRHHYRLVYESDENAGAAEIRKVKEVFGKIKSDYSGIDFQWDLADVSIHKLLLPEDKEDGDYVPFSMIDTDGTADLLGRRSPILRKIPRWFQVARIFADLGRDQKPLQREIAAKCKTYAKG